MNFDNINKSQYYKNALFYKRQKISKYLIFLLIEVTLLTLFILSVTLFHNLILIGFCVTFFLRLPFTYFRNFDYITNLIYFGISKKEKKNLIIRHLIALGLVELATIGLALLFLGYSWAIFALIAILSLFSLAFLIFIEWLSYNNSKDYINIDKNLYL